MKYLCIILLSLSGSVFAQDNDYIFIEPDSIPNCQILVAGKFKEVNTSTDDYLFEISNNIITEYVQNGKYYVRSRLKFTTPCSYTATIIEVTIPDYNLKSGTVFSNEVLETQFQLVKIKARLDDKEFITVLQKLEK